MMRIGINALGLNPGQVGGVEVYLRNLIVNLGKIDPDNEYLVFVDRRNQSVFGADLPPNVRPVVIVLPPPSSPVIRALRYWGWLPSPLADQLGLSSVDVIHYPDSIINPPGVVLPCVLSPMISSTSIFPFHKSKATPRMCYSRAILALSHNGKPAA